MARRIFTGVSGLPLPRRAIRILKERGIYAHVLVSIEHRELARAYVLRGLESGGSAGDVGRYVTFADGDGQKLECLHLPSTDKSADLRPESRDCPDRDRDPRGHKKDSG